MPSSSSSFSLPFFLPQMVLVARNGRTNERTNERALITGWRGTRSITHLFFVGGVVERGCSSPPLPTPFFATSDVCNEGWVAAARRACCTWVRTVYLQKSTTKNKHFLIFSPSKMCFPLLLPFGQWQQKWTGGEKGAWSRREEERGETRPIK